MPIVCGVRFRDGAKVYYFDPSSLDDLKAGDRVIVETSRGREMGTIVLPAHEVTDEQVVGQLKPICRQAAPSDLLDAQRYQQMEAEALVRCRERVARARLDMKLVSAEYNYDGSRLTFYFTAEQRIDFRELVRDLARTFKTRIELRQIGVRDEARIVGGAGKCGRPLCCATWLGDFCPVSIRMAKQQDLPLSPMEISGLCGRLLCCLGYEHDQYVEVKKRFPKVGKAVSCSCGMCKVLRVSALRETATLQLEDGTVVEATAAQIEGSEPFPEGNARGTLDRNHRQALDSALADVTGSIEGEPKPRGGANQDESPARGGISRRPPRSRGVSRGPGRPPRTEDSSEQGDARGARPSTRRRRPRSPGSRGDDEREEEDSLD